MEVLAALFGLCLIGLIFTGLGVGFDATVPPGPWKATIVNSASAAVTVAVIGTLFCLAALVG